jgi:2-methylcitrate dehydratase PrpD
MKETDRRDVLRNAGLAVTAAAIGDPPASAQAQAQASKAALKQAELPNDLTRKLARFIISARLADMPEAVRHEAKRTLLNWVGCALGGSQHETVANAAAALSAFFGAHQATLFGRPERPDVLHAALLNGISSHVLDFDDTHAQTTIHPAAPVAPAILALAEYQQVSGPDFLEALVVGVETECRIGEAVVPAHYDSGWQITGTAGGFGGVAAAGELLGLNEQQMCWAVGLAAVQPVGLIEMFGSTAKSFHPGRAAQNGLAAAHLAAKGFTASEHALEAHSAGSMC